MNNFGQQKVGQQKTLHQRNKSSPALSSMHHGVGLKAQAKRTAFGDLSNTVNALRPSKDDSTIGAKPDKLKENVPPTQLEKKATAFLRPAQRPLSVNAGMKTILSNAATTSIQSLVKQPLVELPQASQENSQLAVTRKVTAKKSTAVFKDTIPVSNEVPVLDLQKPLPSTAPIAPVHRALPPRPNVQPPEDAVESQAESNRVYIRSTNVPQAKKENPIITNAAQISEDDLALRSDGVYIDDHGQVQIYSFTEAPEQRIEPSKLGTAGRVTQSDAQSELQDYVDQMPATSASSVQTLKQAETVVDPMLIRQPSILDSELVRGQKLAPVSEPEEYWEEEEGAENYDEEGYVTARSFKSRGENTTGGATTVLFPKATLKVKKEIALAKELIESSKTAEELEDEAWDTTMVAEYGDEIFQYMRDLEVGCDPTLRRNLLIKVTDQDAAKCPLHGQSSRDTVVYAGCSHGLDRPSPSSLQSPSRNSLPLRQLYRSILVMQSRFLG